MTAPSTDVPHGTVYLSAADRQTEMFISYGLRQSVFDESLIHGILFEPAVVIPDVFHFASNGVYGHLQSHMNQHTQSPLEAAVVKGLVVPAFRDPATADYRTAYEVIGDMGVLGRLDAVKCEAIIGRLDAAAAQGQADGTFRRISWPTHSIGEKFGSRLAKFLFPELDGREDLPPAGAAADLSKLWDRTRRWRTDVLQEAIALGPSHGGFRRSDYQAALGRALGAEGKIDDMSQLLRAAPREQAAALKALCLWINECYHYNQAREFGIGPNWLRYDPELSSATLAAMEIHDRPEVALQRPVVSPEFVEIKVSAPAPPPHVLAHLDGKQLLKVRTDPVGLDYFASLEAWRRNPGSDDAAVAVQGRFAEYARELCKVAAGQAVYTQALMQLRLGRLSGPGQRWVIAAGGAASAVAGSTMGAAPLVALGLGTAAVELAWASYVYLRDRPREMGHTYRVPVELTLT